MHKLIDGQNRVRHNRPSNSSKENLYKNVKRDTSSVYKHVMKNFSLLAEVSHDEASSWETSASREEELTTPALDVLRGTLL